MCASVPAVDPVITAAWIAAAVGAAGIAGTVVTAWLGSRNTRMATEKTIAAGAATTAATLTAAREDRLWDKRCVAYEETLAGLLDERKNFLHGVEMVDLPDGGKELMIVPSHDSPEWVQRQSRLYAYASDAVLAASAAAEDAHTQVQQKQYVLVLLTQQSPGVPLTQQHGEAVQRAAETFNAAIDAGRAAEDALIEVIRAELRAGPEAATLPATVPPERRRIWHRQRG